MVRLSSHRLPFSLSAGAITPIIVPPFLPSGGGWGIPHIKRPRVVEPREPRKPRYATDTGLIELRLTGLVIDRMSARETSAAAWQLRGSALVEFRANDDLLVLYLAGILDYGELLAMGASEDVLELALLLD